MVGHPTTHHPWGFRSTLGKAGSEGGRELLHRGGGGGGEGQRQPHRAHGPCRYVRDGLRMLMGKNIGGEATARTAQKRSHNPTPPPSPSGGTRWMAWGETGVNCRFICPPHWNTICTTVVILCIVSLYIILSHIWNSYWCGSGTTPHVQRPPPVGGQHHQSLETGI